MIEAHLAVVTSLRKHHLKEELGTNSDEMTVIHKRFRSLLHHCLQTLQVRKKSSIQDTQFIIDLVW